MHRPPRDPDQPLFTSGYVIGSLLQGAVVLGAVATIFVLALHRALPEEEARSLAFAALVASNLGLVLVNRSRQASLRTAFRRAHAALWWVTAETAAILTAIVTLEPARELFHFGPLHFHDVGLALGSGLVVLFVLELGKRIFQSG